MAITATARQKGVFITLEGGEGAGKSTQARKLSACLQDRGYEVCLTREPGGTKGAEALRQLLLFGDVSLSWRAEIMLLMAARCDHLDQYISPALKEGKIVICDRFHDSTWAYQGYGRGHARPEFLAFIKSLRQEIAHEPNITFWLDIPVEAGMARVKSRNDKIDRYEGLGKDFHQRVQAGFEQLYRDDQKTLRPRISRIAADRAEDAVTQAILQAIEARGMI